MDFGNWQEMKGGSRHPHQPLTSGLGRCDQRRMKLFTSSSFMQMELIGGSFDDSKLQISLIHTLSNSFEAFVLWRGRRIAAQTEIFRIDMTLVQIHTKDLRKRRPGHLQSQHL